MGSHATATKDGEGDRDCNLMVRKSLDGEFEEIVGDL